jgi:L,D-peptidoglycan transpeptidase YkuD (ErfK/YbiS/YcfS/YnhG family)
MVETKNLYVQAPGTLAYQGKTYQCALGKGGVTKDKQEGDGATPLGTFVLREVFYRPDRLKEPKTKLPISTLDPKDGWSDDPEHPDYNTKIALPHPGRSESLWRKDSVYDVIVVIGYNDNPPQQAKGSAIFMHLAKQDYSPTEGCVALKREDLLEILETLAPGGQIEITAAL